MKIALISPGVLPIPASNGGAVETLIDMFIDYIGTNCPSICIDVFTISENQVRKYENINYIKIKKNNNLIYKILNKFNNLLFNKYFPKKYDFECLKILKKSNYDRILVENNLNIIAHLRHHDVVLHLHNNYLNINNPRSKYIINQCSEIWTVSNFLRNEIIAIDSSYSGKVFVCDNGIRDKFKSLSSIKINKYIYTGRISAEKGVLELIKAFHIHLYKYPDDELFIYGGSFFKNSPQSSYFIKCQKEIKNGNIHMMGYFSNGDLMRELRKYSFCIVPAIWEEPFGLVLVEHIFSGLIPIISNSAGLIEIIGSDYPLIAIKNERFIDNLAHMLDKIKELSRNNEFLEQYSIKRNLCLNKYSYEIYCKRILERLMR